MDGNSGNDRLIGGLEEDIINGGAGNDILIGGAGADSLQGGEGFDTAIYNFSDTGVIVNLATNNISGGHAEGDILVSIEKVVGSNFDDSLVGNNKNNQLIGRDGDDTLIGNEGNDKLMGRVGSDLLTGGSGIDTFIFSSLTDSLLTNLDRITDLEIGTDIIDAPTAIESSEITQLNEVASLSETDIQTILDAESFGVNQGATFTLADRTFLAINDSVEEFSAESDSVIEITGFIGNLADLAVV